MLKKAALIVSFLVVYCTNDSIAQKTAELGLFLGRSYYIGELNPTTHIGDGVGSINYGAAFRYNLNKRYSLKATLIKTKVSAEDKKADLQFNTFRSASLETKITEFAGSIEFNFLPFKAGEKGNQFTPYLFVGLSYYKYSPTLEIESFGTPKPIDDGGGSAFALPFGPGLKLGIRRNWTLAFEWGFRKTSNDLLDGLENRIDDIYETGKSYDNDWFVVSGFMLTYKITNEGSCPSYNF